MQAGDYRVCVKSAGVARTMILDPKADLEDSTAARIAAQAIVRCGLDYKKAAAELWPARKTHAALIQRLKNSAQVEKEIDKIMNREEKRGAARFLDLMWQWIEKDTTDDRDGAENKRTAARILAKGYLKEKTDHHTHA